MTKNRKLKSNIKTAWQMLMNQYYGIAHNKDDNKQNEDDKNDCDNVWGILNDLQLLEG